MTPIERMECVLDGRMPDRPPVCFWRHFSPEDVWGSRAVAAHLDHLESFDLDFVKVMNDNPYPHSERVEDARGLASIQRLGGNEPEFVRQLDLIAELRRRLGNRLLMTTTVFNAWATLRHMVRPPKFKHSPPNMNASEDDPSQRIKAMYGEDPRAVKAALQVISENLGRFAKRCIAAGADGVFMSVRDDWLDQAGSDDDLYSELLTPCDLHILESVSDAHFNMLHVCGAAVRFRRFADYPVHVINWADREAGPAISEVRDWMRPVICAGVNNLQTLPKGSPGDCAAEVRDAVRLAGAHPLIIAPGCTYDPELVPQANLKAVRNAAGEAVYNE